jgi:hypothetical protein
MMSRTHFVVPGCCEMLIVVYALMCTGAPAATNTFGSFGATTFGGQQRVGSRVSPYAVTNDTDTGVGGQPGKFLCISAMPAYKNKSQEELRWEDYQAGDKGTKFPLQFGQVLRCYCRCIETCISKRVVGGLHRLL